MTLRTAVMGWLVAMLPLTLGFWTRAPLGTLFPINLKPVFTPPIFGFPIPFSGINSPCEYRGGSPAPSVLAANLHIANVARWRHERECSPPTGNNNGVSDSRRRRKRQRSSSTRRRKNRTRNARVQVFHARAEARDGYPNP